MNSQVHEVLLTGKVLDKENRKALEGATIYIENLKKGTTTDLKGEYKFTIPLGNHIIKVSYVGYVSSITQLNI